MKKNTIIGLLCIALCFSSIAQAQFTKKMIGYQSWWGDNSAGIDYANLTHINYAFVVPHSDGNGRLADVPEYAVDKFRRVLAKAKANNVKVLLSVGGWLSDYPYGHLTTKKSFGIAWVPHTHPHPKHPDFPEDEYVHPIRGGDANDPRWNMIISDPVRLTTFVNNLMKIVDDNDLDGIDLDWEFPNNTASNWSTLVRRLSSELKGRGKLFTAAVVSHPYAFTGGSDPVKLFDFVNLMAYNFHYPNGVADYSSHLDITNTIDMVNYWLNTKKIPKDKIIVGFTTGAQNGLGNNRETTSHFLYKAEQVGAADLGGIMVWRLNELGRNGIDSDLIMQMNRKLNPFNPDKKYNVGDKVYYLGKIYVSIHEAPLGQNITPAGSPWFWELISASARRRDTSVFNPSKTYNLGDKVTFEGRSYLSINEITRGGSGITPTESPWFWQLISTSVNNTPVFNPSKTYNLGDKVSFEGRLYVSINEITRGGSGITPTESPWFWHPL